MIGLPTSARVVVWLAAQQELEIIQRQERILYRTEGTAFKRALEEIGPIEGVVVG